MNLDELRQEKAEIVASRVDWVRRLQEAQAAMLAAQLQLAAHDGHLGRIDIWLRRLAEEKETPPAE
jgi:hypothetical protein